MEPGIRDVNNFPVFFEEESASNTSKIGNNF